MEFIDRIPGIEVTDVMALRQWLESTEHLYQCIGYSEGQYCCIEKLRVLHGDEDDLDHGGEG